jgi:hypothetical protein
MSAHQSRLFCFGKTTAWRFVDTSHRTTCSFRRTDVETRFHGFQRSLRSMQTKRWVDPLHMSEEFRSTLPLCAPPDALCFSDHGIPQSTWCCETPYHRTSLPTHAMSAATSFQAPHVRCNGRRESPASSSRLLLSVTFRRIGTCLAGSDAISRSMTSS